MKTRILLAEDDPNLGMILTEYLETKDFDVKHAHNGDEAFKFFMSSQYDLCLFDVMMPIKDGFVLAKEIRDVNSEIPIIFLTAKALKEDVLQGFKLGADDYITKPFSMEELMYRIDAVLKRTKKDDKSPTECKLFKLGKFDFDANQQQLISAEGTRKLTTKESELLRLLCLNKNQVLERNFALKSIWEDDNIFNARSMDVYITKLRKYFAEEPNVEILNIHGRGYKLLINA